MRSFDWLLQSRNGGAEGGALEPAPSAASSSLGMAEGANNATVQELVKITGCEWQLCTQALQASGEDPQRYALRRAFVARRARHALRSAHRLSSPLPPETSPPKPTCLAFAPRLWHPIAVAWN